MAKKTFMKGAAILGAAGIIVKLLGAFFRIPLANIIGDTGMAYYQTAYPVYVLLLTLSTAGIPTAIARMVSERTAEGRYRDAHRVFQLSFILLAIIGASSAAVLFFGANLIVGMLRSPAAALAMKTIAPALLFVPMMAAFRGYFQGRQDMTPTALSQISEQLVRVVCGLALAMMLVPMGVSYAAAGASFGAAAGGIGGLAVIVAVYLIKRPGITRERQEDTSSGPVESAGQVLKPMILIAIPITIGAAILPIMSNIDLVIVIRRLTATGYSLQEAKELYGQLSGFAAPLINFPQVLTQSVAMSLVPAIAAAHNVGDTDFMRKNISMGLRTSLIIGLPCAIGLAVLAKPIMILLYPKQLESALSAAGCLVVLALGVIFLSSVQTLTGILQGVGRQMVPVKNLCIGACAKVVVTYVLTGIPSVNVKGAAAGTLCAYFIASWLNLRAVKKYTGTSFDISLTYIKPMIAAVLMGGAVAAIYAGLSLVAGNAISTLTAISCGIVIYAMLLFALKALTDEEILMLPKGRKIHALVTRFRR